MPRRDDDPVVAMTAVVGAWWSHRADRGRARRRLGRDAGNIRPSAELVQGRCGNDDRVATTVLQDERFHQVADKFDKPTQRRVERLVLRGTPPVDNDLVPLARAYAAYLAPSSGDARLNGFAFWAWTAFGLFWIAEGAYKLFGTGDSLVPYSW